MSLQSFVIETTEASHCQHLDHHDPWSSWSSLLPQRIKTKNSWWYEEFRLVMMINNLWDLWNIQRSSPLVRLQHSWACGSLQDLPRGQPWWQDIFLHSNSCTLGLLLFANAMWSWMIIRIVPMIMLEILPTLIILRSPLVPPMIWLVMTITESQS